MTKKKPGAKRGRPRKDGMDQLVVDLAAVVMENMPRRATAAPRDGDFYLRSSLKFCRTIVGRTAQRHR